MKHLLLAYNVYRSLSCLVVCICLLSLSACSDNAASPGDPNNGGNGGNGGDKDRLTIVAMDQDSVYWEDLVTITLKNMKSNALSLFLHTVPVVIDRLWMDTNGNGGIHFRVPQGASTGKVRIYEHDSIEASNGGTLVVLPKVQAEMQPSVSRFMPQIVYPGEIVAIHGEDFPLRFRDIEAKLGVMSVPVVATSLTQIQVRVPQGATTDQLSLRLFGMPHILGTLTIAEHQGTLMEGTRLSSIKVKEEKLNGNIRSVQVTGGDSTIGQRTGKLAISSMSATILPLAAQTSSSDSLVFLGTEKVGDRTQIVEIRLKLEPQSKASGVIMFETIDKTVGTAAEVHIKSMSWFKQGSIYHFRTVLPSMNDELVSLVYIAYNHITRSTATFTNADFDGSLSIDLEATP